MSTEQPPRDSESEASDPEVEVTASTKAESPHEPPSGGTPSDSTHPIYDAESNSTLLANSPSAQATDPAPPTRADAVSTSDGAGPGALVLLGRAKAWGLTLICALVAFVLMASDQRLRLGVPLGLAATAGCTFGLLRLIGRFRAPADTLATPALPMTGAIWTLVGALLAHASCIVLAVGGRLPVHQVSAALLVTGSFVALLGAGFRFLKQLGVYQEAEELQLTSRHGFWLLVLTALLYLPMLGNFGLIDPWETHYGEVARETLARDDWISLWWAQDGWFWSKPILNFWLQSLSFKFFGVHYMPGQVLSVTHAQPEWACRLPIFWLAAGAIYVLYKGSARAFGKTPALIGALIVTTCPYWFLLARQTMADMPYVAPVVGAMGFLLLGFTTDPERLAAHYRVRFRGNRFLDLNAFHLLFGAILMCALPQIGYLISRNITLHAQLSWVDGVLELPDPFGFRIHWDEFARGSGGDNCGQAGNKRCSDASPVWHWAQPGLAALLWTLALGVLLFINRKEQRLQRLYFMAGWLCTALAVMGKGAPGLVIPLTTALAYLVVTGRFRELLRLELPALTLLLLCVALPWYVQMFARHGFPFIERLILHDMVKRAFQHVHDTNKGDDLSFRYYVWQLGYGLFPWTGFAGAGLLWMSRARERIGELRHEATLILMIWFLVAFGMFTITLTKFHHYILPLVPPTGLFAGVLLAEYLPSRLPATRLKRLLYFGGQLIASGLCIYGLMRLFPGGLLGQPTGEEASSMVGLGIGCLVAGILLTSATIRWCGSQLVAERVLGTASRHKNALLGALAIGAVVSLALAGRDMTSSEQADLEGQARLLHLFTYNYDRKWPQNLDFNAILSAFVLFFALAGSLFALPRLRHHASVTFCSGALLWTAWTADVYLVELSPHWGQRETMQAYYDARKGPSEPLIAYQMNWKGENFYTGNRMATFVSSGKKFKKWIKKQRRKNISTFFVTTEHSRLRTLKRELGKYDNYELITDKELNNKFALVRVSYGELKPKVAKYKGRGNSASASRTKGLGLKKHRALGKPSTSSSAQRGVTAPRSAPTAPDHVH